MTTHPDRTDALLPCRKAFEEQFKIMHGNSRLAERQDDGTYRTLYADRCWKLWQAAWNTRAIPAAVEGDLSTILALLPEHKPDTLEELPDSAYREAWAAQDARKTNSGFNLATALIRKRIKDYFSSRAHASQNAPPVEPIEGIKFSLDWIKGWELFSELEDERLAPIIEAASRYAALAEIKKLS